MLRIQACRVISTMEAIQDMRKQSVASCGGIERRERADLFRTEPCQHAGIVVDHKVDGNVVPEFPQADQRSRVADSAPAQAERWQTVPQAKTQERTPPVRRHPALGKAFAKPQTSHCLSSRSHRGCPQASG